MVEPIPILKKIIVFQTWGIGDMIMAIPMISALREQFPESRVTVVAGSETSAEIVLGSNLCDEVRLLSPHKMNPLKVMRWFYTLRSEYFDAAIICTRISHRLAQLLRLISAIQFIAGDSPPPRPWGYTRWCPVQGKTHRIISNMDILSSVCSNVEAGEFRLDWGRRCQAKSSVIWSDLDVEGQKTLGIHPGSEKATKQKRMSVSKHRSLIRLFLNRFPEAKIVVFVGPHEVDVMESFSDFDDRVLIAANVSLSEIGFMISKINVLVAGDTALGHIAASQGIPVVTLAGPTEISSTGPWGDENIVIRTDEKLDCMPCYGTPLYGHCPHDHRCMGGIDERRIVDALEPIFQTT